MKSDFVVLGVESDHHSESLRFPLFRVLDEGDGYFLPRKPLESARRLSAVVDNNAAEQRPHGRMAKKAWNVEVAYAEWELADENNAAVAVDNGIVVVVVVVVSWKNTAASDGVVQVMGIPFGYGGSDECLSIASVFLVSWLQTRPDCCVQ